MRKQGVMLGIASRTSAPDLARQALQTLKLADHDGSAMSIFSKQAIEIYPGSKLAHFKSIHKRTGIPYDEMVFYDDESRNREVAQLGVTFVLVPQGVTRSVFEKGLQDWARGKKQVSRRPEENELDGHERDGKADHSDEEA
jgi:magnesium-dependent phosphatase 1